jgi:hypothetical protein
MRSYKTDEAIRNYNLFIMGVPVSGVKISILKFDLTKSNLFWILLKDPMSLKEFL